MTHALICYAPSLSYSASLVYVSNLCIVIYIVTRIFDNYTPQPSPSSVIDARRDILSSRLGLVYRSFDDRKGPLMALARVGRLRIIVVGGLSVDGRLISGFCKNRTASRAFSSFHLASSSESMPLMKFKH